MDRYFYIAQPHRFPPGSCFRRTNTRLQSTSEAHLTEPCRDEHTRHNAEKRLLCCLYSLDPQCADAYALLSLCYLGKGEHDQAAAMSEKAVALAPNHAEILALSAIVRNKSGRPEIALDLIKKARRLCPNYPG